MLNNVGHMELNLMGSELGNTLLMLYNLTTMKWREKLKRKLQQMSDKHIE